MLNVFAQNVDVAATAALKVQLGGDSGADHLKQIYSGDNELFDKSFFVLASYLLPTEVGFGKLQPLVRFQGATPKAGGDLSWLLEAQIGYIVVPYSARLALVYTRSDVLGVSGNSVTLGVQLQK